MVRTVLAEGGFLDLATTGEVQLVERLGVQPQRCIHTHPIKRAQDIRNAIEFGVSTFVADNPDEVRKFARLTTRSAAAAARLVPQSRGDVRPVTQVRLRSGRLAGAGAPGRQPRHPTCAGCPSTSARRPPDPAKHVEAIEACARLMAAARREKLGPFDILDIGGGFPIDYLQPVEHIGAFLRAAARSNREAAASASG